jgi:N-acetylated-alpha-linked acidic dipeptidase
MDQFTRFVDPGFRYGVSLAQTAGRIVLRLAGADVLPFDFVPLADALGRAVRETAAAADALREEAAETNRNLTDKVYALTDDPLHHLLPPKARQPVPALDVSPLDQAVGRLAASAAAYRMAMSKAAASGFALPAAARADLGRVLMQAERALTRSEGLPRRPWYRHQVWGPVSSTGTFRPFPGVREAIEQRNWQEAADQIGVAAGVVDVLAHQLDRAAALLGTPAEAQVRQTTPTRQ